MSLLTHIYVQNCNFLIDDVSCVTDHNECDQGTDDCEQICINHVGSYSCSCGVGCDLVLDGISCRGMKVFEFAMEEKHVVSYVWLFVCILYV